MTHVHYIYVTRAPHLYVTDSVVYRFWTPADWVDETKTKRVFYLDRISGHVTVKKSGVYMVYAQVSRPAICLVYVFILSVDRVTQSVAMFHPDPLTFLGGGVTFKGLDDRYSADGLVEPCWFLRNLFGGISP